MSGRPALGAAVALALVAATAVLTATATPAAADPIRDRQWYRADLDMAEVQRISRGAGVTVAVIDTGVDAEHRDLAGAVLPGYNVRHERWEEPSGREDVDGHGTHMAGIIAGRGHGSGDGVLGIAPAARILPISAPVHGIGSAPFLKECVDFAIAHHAGVINMSFSGVDEEQMRQAVRTALAADIVLVAAAGNRGEEGGAYPGRYPEVLTVGAYGRDRRIAAYSVTGPQLDLAAPGDRIVTTDIGDTGYSQSSGTSGAAAVVSGAAALLRARYPAMTAAEVTHRLTATAEDAGPPGRDGAYGYGRLNILRALTADVTPLRATSDASSGTPAASPAPAGTLAADLPRPAGPLTLAAVVAGLVLVVGTVTAVAVRRNRRARRPL